MTDPKILDSMADTIDIWAFHYREHLPQKIFDMARSFSTALYKEAVRANDKFDIIFRKKINRCED